MTVARKPEQGVLPREVGKPIDDVAAAAVGRSLEKDSQRLDSVSGYVLYVHHAACAFHRGFTCRCAGVAEGRFRSG